MNQCYVSCSSADRYLYINMLQKLLMTTTITTNTKADLIKTPDGNK